MKTLNRKANYYVFFSQQVWALPLLKKRLSGVAWKAMGTWRSMSQVYWCFIILVMKSSRKIPLEKWELPYSEVFLVANLPDFLLFFLFFNWSTDDLQYCVNFHTWSFPGKHTGMGSHSFLQGIILTQRLNLGLWHCRQILYHLSHRGSPGYRCTAKWSSYTYFFKGYFPL